MNLVLCQRKFWGFDCVKARRIDDRKLIRIALIRINLRSSILRSFHISRIPKIYVDRALSLNAKNSLFASFSASSKTASWSTFTSMSYEAVLKSAKKNIKNQNFRIKG